MKRFFLTFALAAFALSAWAEGTPQKPSWEGFVSNGFWDNWEVSAGIGVGTAISNGTNPGTLGNRINFEGNVSATKWLHPVAGVRAQLQGGRFANFDAELGKLTWPYLFVHTDLMVNVSNWIGGYRDDRAYYAVPFFGFGYMASNFSDKSQMQNLTGTHQAFAFAYGILSKFRISPAVDFNIELKGLVAPSRMCPAQTSGSYLMGFSATAGFTYRFNKRGWERAVSGYTADDIRAFQQAVSTSNAALEAEKAENARLSAQLEAARAEAAAAAEAAKKSAAEKAAAPTAQGPCPSSVILYDYSMSKLTPKEKTRLELMADLIKSGPKDRVYRIEGHADKQTGTVAGNERVALNRAKSVYDYLVSLGVDPKQLTYEGKGAMENPFEQNQKANRAVIIE